MGERWKGVLAAILPVIGFAAGAGIQDLRVRDVYRNDGRIDAYYDMIHSGYMVYLGCLADDCAKEKFASEIMVQSAKDHLRRALPNPGAPK